MAVPVEKPLMASVDVDAVVRAEWRKAGILPSSRADDAAFLRRVYIDVVGTIPTYDETSAFLADRAPDKRDRLVAKLLASPDYAEHWAAHWDDMLMGEQAKGQEIDRAAFRDWLRSAFAKNTSWDKLVYGILSATGQNSAGGSPAESNSDPDASSTDAPVNGAVNWTLKYQAAPQDLAGAASRTFLGVQIQCAQCHDHKTEKWKQGDFQRFAAPFMRTRIEPIDRGPTMGRVRRIVVEDLPQPAPRFSKMADLQSIAAAKPTALDGTDLSSVPDARQAMAAWATSPANPWFAKETVNRMWAHFFGRGFVDPVDDIRPSNPVTMQPLFDALTADFVASGYDLEHLIRIVVGTETYALSSSPLADATAKADPEVKEWERFRLTPLGPEELLNALMRATSLETIIERSGKMNIDQVRLQLRRRYNFLFDVDEESDRDDFEGTITQALALLNGTAVAAGASVLPGSAVASVLSMPTSDEAAIEALYLRALSRRPTGSEIEYWTKYIAEEPSAAMRSTEKTKRTPQGQPDPLRGLENRVASLPTSPRARAYEDLFWTLLNSSEFLFNH